MRKRAFLPTVLATVGSVLLAGPAAAQSGVDQELRAIIDAQARRIQALSDRVEALEGHPTAATPLPIPDMQQQLAANGGDATPSSTASAVDVTSTAGASPPSATKGGQVLVDWHAGGPTFSSPDGRFTFHPRGRVLADVSTTGGSRFDDRNLSGTEFRNVRLGGEGNMGELAYRMEADFAGNEVRLRDAFIGWETKIGDRDLRAYFGNKLNDRSIDGATSITAIPFAERNAVGNIILPQVGIYGLGLFASIAGDNGHVSMNIRGEDAGNNDGSRNDSLVYMARAHVAPVRGDVGLVHLGIWGFHEKLNTSVTRLTPSAIEGSDFNQNLAVMTGPILDPRSNTGFGVEGGGIWRTLWTMGEYGERHIRVHTAPNVTETAWSISGGWFPTGEKPPFSASTGTWSRPHVLRPVTQGGYGAFELLARYDEVDLTDAPVGGRGHNFTLASNWYLNNWIDLKLNWIRYSLWNPAGDFPGSDSGSTLILRGEISF